MAAPRTVDGRSRAGRRRASALAARAVGVLVVISLAALVCLPGCGTTVEQVTAPNLVSLDEQAGLQAAAAVGLVAVPRYEYSPTVPAGLVVRQNPAARSSAPVGGRIDFWLSRGPWLLLLPDFSGEAPADAAQWLRRYGLRAEVVQGRSAAADPGRIYGQEPAPGVGITAGQAVTLWSNGAARVVEVPDVRGLTLEEAQQGLRAARLGYAGASGEPSLLVPQGTVLAQSVPPGSLVAERSGIELVLSTGAAGRVGKLPTVVGLGENKALAALQRAGFRTVMVGRQSSQVPAGRVTAQVPAGGQRATIGSLVQLIVSSGSAPPGQAAVAFVPNVVGLVAPAAWVRLAAAGFVFVISEPPTPPYGKVVGQRPAAGEPYAVDRLVHLQLAH
jgi:beta-lactam-binding protein with PASTA domain